MTSPEDEKMSATRPLTEIRAGGRVAVTFEGALATFTLQRPQARNAMDLDTITALYEFTLELARRPDIVAVIITGAAPCFAAGGDLQQFARLKGADAGATLSSRMGKVLNQLEVLDQLVIAAINGDAYGGGVELALACDVRLMDEAAKLVLAQSRFGLTTGWGGGHRLTRLVGADRAMVMMLEARPIEAPEALRLGMVTRVCEAGAVLERARELAELAARRGRPLVTGVKRVVRSAVLLPEPDAAAEERAIFAQLWGTDAHEEKVTAFLARKQRADGDAMT